MSRFLLLVSFVVVCGCVLMIGPVVAAEKAGKDSSATYAQRDLKPLDIGSLVLKTEDRSGSVSTSSTTKKKVTSSKKKTKKLSAAKKPTSKKASHKKSTKSNKSKWQKKSPSTTTSKKAQTN